MAMPAADVSRKHPAGDLGDGEHAAPPEPAPRPTLCEIVHLRAMNGFGAAVGRCVCVCRNMRTNVELWERVVDLPHRVVGKNGEKRVTRLMHWAREGDLARVRETLDRGAHANVRNTRGLTALWYASIYGHLTVVRELLDRGADVDTCSFVGWTALFVASGNGHAAVVLELAARGADVNTACRGGHAATAAELLRLGADVNTQDNAGLSALILAAF